MPSENFDNKIKDAAGQHHPNYDEKAWAKMEKLLDQHLPQKKNRRRFIFLLLFLLLAGGGAWLVINKPWQQSDQTLNTANTPNKNEAEQIDGPENEVKERPASPGNLSADKKTIAEPEPGIENSILTNNKKDIVIADQAGNNKQNRNQDVMITGGNVKTSRYKQDKMLPKKISKADQLAMEIESADKMKKDKDLPQNNTTVSSPGSNNDRMVKNDDTKLNNEETKTRTDLPADNKVAQNKTSEPKKNSITEPTETTDKKNVVKKTSNKKSNSFFFSVSAGPDISSVGFDNPGKVKLLAGAGFGYTFKERWTIRTGFYTGRKVYSASREEYKPSVQPQNYNYLDNISANCKVYEIPLNIAYHFSQSKKHNLFAAVGLSSFIMKKETYVYFYKYAGGQTYSYTKNINDENKHYFSVLTLSGGYQRKINKTFSIAAEPYIKLPMAGVGFGKVKLNSAGILITVNISPFQSGAKK
jgi:hypothetical protein